MRIRSGAHPFEWVRRQLVCARVRDQRDAAAFMNHLPMELSPESASHRSHSSRDECVCAMEANLLSASCDRRRRRAHLPSEPFVVSALLISGLATGSGIQQHALAPSWRVGAHARVCLFSSSFAGADDDGFVVARLRCGLSFYCNKPTAVWAAARGAVRDKRDALARVAPACLSSFAATVAKVISARAAPLARIRFSPSCSLSCSLRLSSVQPDRTNLNSVRVSLGGGGGAELRAASTATETRDRPQTRAR